MKLQISTMQTFERNKFLLNILLFSFIFCILCLIFPINILVLFFAPFCDIIYMSLYTKLSFRVFSFFNFYVYFVYYIFKICVNIYIITYSTKLKLFCSTTRTIYAFFVQFYKRYFKEA